MPSAFLGILLFLALLPATVRSVAAQAWFHEGRTHAWLAKAEVDQRTARERVERGSRDTADVRGRNEKRSPGAGTPPAGGGHALVGALAKWRGRAAAHQPQLEASLEPPAPIRDQRISIRRNRASAHVPHLGEDDPASVDHASDIG